ncbi:uncharacterized protein J7T54_001759 [Emericellopsis cladophorae]|uniref:Uncharacterized protein n=1 Tax=Emericellopsis cladophorae TaxID=2686198 RepID=A0A9P9Y5D0_9HYPO|nr:uncharacterized protein J7T54_001759 [Emericellopsis cladophorae]KAI6783883.1 hypothetical protein J7T54_001759 [Emericellopsis cladophorae]
MSPSSYQSRPILNPDAESQHLARAILARSSSTDELGDFEDDSMINMLLLVLGLVFVALVFLSALFLIRRRRMQQRMHNGILPSYNDSKLHSHGRGPPQGLTIETSHDGRSSTIYISRNGQPMLANPNSPPHSPDNVPEIHITFPDEHDNEGRHQSGRVLVVRVGDNATVGLEPVQEEQLPAYEKESKGDFYSVDMDQIGGLKEKDRTTYQ